MIGESFAVPAQELIDLRVMPSKIILAECCSTIPKAASTFVRKR
jgi:hypothetical protein